MLPSTFRTTLRTTPASALVATPWKFGTTTELAIFPPGAQFSARDFDARVSTATVTADCPFSDFSGFRRILALLGGNGMTLTVDGNSHALAQPFSTLEFDGGSPAAAALTAGPIIDFNVIFRPHVAARVQHVRLGQSFTTVFSPSAQEMGEPNALRTDIIWSPNQPLELEFGRTTTRLNLRDVYQLDHDGRHLSLLARSTEGDGDALMVNLAFPAPRGA